MTPFLIACDDGRLDIAQWLSSACAVNIFCQNAVSYSNVAESLYSNMD